MKMTKNLIRMSRLSMTKRSEQNIQNLGRRLKCFQSSNRTSPNSELMANVTFGLLSLLVAVAAAAFAFLSS